MKRLLTFSLLLSLGLAAAQAIVWPDEWSRDAAEARSGGTLRDWSTSNPRTLNPFVSAESNAVLDITDGGSAAILIRRGPLSDEWLPHAAAAFEVSDDGTVVDVSLRDGILWSDGTPVTVQDYYFRYQAETDAEVGANAFDSWFIEGEAITLEVTSDTTLRFTFPRPDRLAFPVVALRPAPDHILGDIYREGGAEALKEAWGTETPVAETVWTSPWIPTSFIPDERIIFQRNPSYGQWNTDASGHPLPYLDEYIVNLVESGDAALNLYLAGEIDIFSPRNLDDIGVINVAIQNRDLDATVLENISPTASSQFIVFNMNKASDPFLEGVFRDERFRQAMSHLTDREAIIELVYGGSAEPMHSGVYTVLSYWVNPDVSRFDYDPEAAQALLAEMGFEDRNSAGFLVDAEGRELGFSLVTNAGNVEREQIAQLFGDAARDAGVNVEVQTLDFNVMVDQLLSTGDDRPFDAILIGLVGGSRDWPFGPNVIPCGTNLHMYNQAGACLFDWEREMERLFFQGRQELDTERARDIGFALQEAQAKAQPQIYTVSPQSHVSFLNRVGGLHPEGFVNTIVGSRQLVLTFLRE